ncbi:hypothetical protein K2173_010110 [Erythroxylum novogranatense]|uniref:Protein kinase domain-containing protein n=1 Tax=Erythroxylum novogranatense TaxID=1862640 RepID=A0AAV8TSX7_9ROSI|nr:hypothetical protein K2173_010110 [Erythroxylum novogranatense]
MTKSKKFLRNMMRFFQFGSTREGNNEEDLERIAAQEQKQFRFETLVSATKDFHPTHKLGEGGFGPVYKGTLDNGREIAVKKLSHSSNQGMKQFTNEAKLLARVQHRNIVNLVGYCAHSNEKLLIYEYVANESLDRFIFKPNKKELLDWKKRYDIITGIARGLLYLHEDSHCCIIHRDIKASNILLDDKWVPKIADFGMARLFPEDQTHVNTRVAGTTGYMAPEYVMHGKLTVKADVFSFGVLILELMSGQRNSTFNQHSDGQNVLDWAYKLHRKDRSLDIMDPVLQPSAAIERVKTCIHIGLLCVQGDPQIRPYMRQVVVWLSRKPESLNLPEPVRPGIPGSRYRRTHRPPGMSSTAGTSIDNSHTNDTTLNTNTVSTSTSALTSPPRSITDRGKRPMGS